MTDELVLLQKKKKRRKRLIAWICVTMALVLLFGVCAWYLGDYYRADRAAIEAYAPIYEMDFYVRENGSVVFEPENAVAGLIFYPGGKVEHTAYIPLMAACAKEGILCVIVEMPFRLAVLDKNAADGIREDFPNVKNWYIGGHSLGGSMAASYLKKNAEGFDGLILLGAYATADLSETELQVLSIYGSEDGVMNREKYEKYKGNLPDDLIEVELIGGCHAYFGAYGEQKGDGTPILSQQEQISLTAEQIGALVLGKDGYGCPLKES